MSLMSDCQASTARVEKMLLERGLHLKSEPSDEASEPNECVAEASAGDAVEQPSTCVANKDLMAGTSSPLCTCDSEASHCASTAAAQEATPRSALPRLVINSEEPSESSDDDLEVVATLSSATSGRRPSLPNVDKCLSLLEKGSGAATFGRAQ